MNKFKKNATVFLLANQMRFGVHGIFGCFELYDGVANLGAILHGGLMTFQARTRISEVSEEMGVYEHRNISRQARRNTICVLCPLQQNRYVNSSAGSHMNRSSIIINPHR